MGQRELPWFVRGSIEYLESILTSDMVVFEWGSGRSTQWFADRVKSIISIEHQKKWYDIVAMYLKKRNNAKLLLIEEKHPDYPKVISGYADETFDLVVIDGRRRVECFKEAVSKIKTNGYLLFDDVQRSRYNAAKSLFRSWPNQEFKYAGNAQGKGRKTTGIYQKCPK